jgi:ubiquinone biosynthesis protein
MGVVSQLWRATRILWAFGRRNLFWGLYRDLYQGQLTNQDCGCEADRRVERRAARLREALEELGPTFVKLGQVLSRRPDLAPRAYLQELEKLQDQAGPVPFRAIRAQLVARCICAEQMRHEQHDPHCLHCVPFEKIFDAFDETPVAAASLAQVHRAVFRGHPVAVKVLRPGVLDRINTDLAIMRRCRRLLIGSLGLAGSLDPREFFETFRRRLQGEVDLKAEALNIDRFRANRDPEGPITAPNVFWEFRRSDLLVMEFVEGQPIGSAARLRRAARRKLAQALVRDYLTQIFVDDFFHADPHPGNLFLDRDHRLVYLDFGAMGQLGAAVRRQLYQLVRAMIEADPDRALRAVLGLGQTDAARVDMDGLRQELARIIYLCRSRPGSRWSDEMIEASRRYGIRLPRGVLALAKGLVLVESVALELDPAFSFFEELQAVAPQVGLHAAEERVTRDLPRLLEDYAEAIARLPALLHQLGQRASERDMSPRDHRHHEAET